MSTGFAGRGLALLSALALAGSAASEAPLPLTAAPSTSPPAAVMAEELSFDSDGARLHGTLYRPNGVHPSATLIVLHGASVPLRSAPLYRHLREGLPPLGMAVFIFDRRGSGESQQGRASPGDFDQLARDGVAAFAMLSRHPEVDPKRIGFWGLSQGGWLTLLAAAKEPRAAYAIAISAPMAAADVQMNYAVGNILRVKGYPPATVDTALRDRTLVDDYRRGKATRAQAEAAVASARAQPWWRDSWLEGNIDDPEWLQQITANPLEAVDTSRVPTLILYGRRDLWVPVEPSVLALERQPSRHPQVTLRVIADADHALMMNVDPRDQMNAALAVKDAPDAPAYFTTLAAWLMAHGAVDGLPRP